MENLNRVFTPDRREIIALKREKGKIYLGIPSGSLYEQVIRLCQKAGMIKESPGRIYKFQSLFKGIIFQILDRKEMAVEVALGTIDAGITGKDYIEEFGNPNEVEFIQDFIFSKKSNQPSRLVMISDPKVISTIEETKGKAIFTELPKLTSRKLKEGYGFSENDLRNLCLSYGKTEQKLYTGRADAVTDIVETGETIKANGFAELATLFYSNPQLIGNLNSLKDPAIREVIEDFGASLNAILKAEKCPLYSVIMNVPRKKLEEVLAFLPSDQSPTISALQESDWVAVNTLIPQADFNRIAPKLIRLGAKGIVPSKVDAIYRKD